MNRPRPSLPAALAAALAVLATAACRDDAAPASASPPARDSQGVTGFFAPQPGESWTYAVTRDFAPGTRLPAAEDAAAIVLANGAKRTTFERRRICAGTEQPAGAEKELTAFTLYEGERLVEREFYDITAEGLVARGWTPAPESTPAINPPAAAVMLNPGVKIALPGMAGGQSWDASGPSSGSRFRLDVIERTTVKVPAGEFDASRIRLTSTSPKRTTKRTVWFAENVGIVKEQITRFSSERILVKEELVLTKWTLPGDTAPDPDPSDHIKMETEPPAGGGPDPAPEDGETAGAPAAGDSPDAPDQPDESGVEEVTDEAAMPDPQDEPQEPDEAPDPQDKPGEADNDTGTEKSAPPPAKADPPPPKALIIEE